MTAVTLLSKLSLKGLKAQPLKNSVKDGAPFAIAYLYGHANKHNIITTPFGDSVRFVGSFKGVNATTGEAYRSGKLFMPSIIEEMVADAIDNSDGPVEFAFEIGVEYSEKGNMGYAYTVKPLVEIKESEPLQRLDGLVQGKLKALRAPAAAPEKKAAAKAK